MYTIQLRRDTAARWARINPVLADGEPGVERGDDDVKKLKIGDGSTPWNDLDYASGGGTGSGIGPRGPQGIPGPIGPEGPTGPIGPRGLKGDKGDPGVAGPAGPAGIAGSQGIQGVPGPKGSDGNSFNYRGDWDSATAFAVDDVVFYSGSSWIARAANTDSEPSGASNDWDEIAIAGSPGPPGVDGAQGPAGPAGPAGPRGNPGPQGLQGAQGNPGPKGDPGATGPSGIQGPVGDTGPAGPAGPAGPPGPAGSGGGTPVGAVMAWTSPRLPPAHVLANGGRYTKATYPDGYAYAKAEADAGNTLWTYRTADETFTVPNFTDKFILAPGATRQISATGGQETVLLTARESGLRDHSHAVYQRIAGTGDKGGAVPYVNSNIPNFDSFNAPTNGSGNAAALDAHTNMPPYIVLAQIVKIAGVTFASDPWQPLTLDNDWGNIGDPYATAQWRQVGDEIQLRGAITKGSGSATAQQIAHGAPGPPKQLYLRVASVVGDSTIEIYADGSIHVAGSAFAAGDLSLNNIRYSII